MNNSTCPPTKIPSLLDLEIGITKPQGMVHDDGGVSGDRPNFTSYGKMYQTFTSPLGLQNKQNKL